MCVVLTDELTVHSHTSLQTELHGTQRRLSPDLFHGTQFVIVVPTLTILYFIWTSLTLLLDVVSASYRSIPKIKNFFWNHNPTPQRCTIFLCDSPHTHTHTHTQWSSRVTFHSIYINHIPVWQINYTAFNQTNFKSIIKNICHLWCSSYMFRPLQGHHNLGHIQMLTHIRIF